MEQFKEILAIVLGCVAILGIIYGLAKYFSRLEQGTGDKCKSIFICPYIEDLKELKTSLSGVREDVAELKGTVNGINTTLNLLSGYVREFPCRKISD